MLLKGATDDIAGILIFHYLLGPINTSIHKGYYGKFEIMYKLCESLICVINVISFQLILNPFMHDHTLHIDSL